MNAPLPEAIRKALESVTLDDKYSLEHGRAFMSAIKPYNKDVEYVEYLEEWHGWYKLETNVDFWGRVERFLAKQIGSERGSAAPAASSPP